MAYELITFDLDGTLVDTAAEIAEAANLAIERGRPITKGMVVITGSVIPTLPIKPADVFSFALDGLGAVEMTAN